VTGRARARDLGIAVGALRPGPVNAITDVPGIRVGHTTLIEGPDIRTGVTAIVPDMLTGACKLPAALFVFNGFGKLVGSTQLDELGEIETPVLLTSTLATFAVADALVSYMLALPGNERLASINPVVGETNDGFLSDARRRPVTAAHVHAAIASAAGGRVAEGCVGAGTGTGALGFKAGIGTASRQVRRDGALVTVGALVQANFSGTLTILGTPVPAPPATDDMRAMSSASHGEPGGSRGAQPPDGAEPPDVGNSCVIVLATDAPLDSRQLGRVARRSVTAMARTGSDFAGHSGDYALAFSTASSGTGTGRGEPVPENELDVIFTAAAEATEEAILNSLFMAVSMTGYRGRSRPAVPLDDIRALVSGRSAGRSGS
jgi:D-aminopeptidase